MSERAKIFQPFNPVHGLDEARTAMETIRVPEAEMTPEKMEEINNVLVHLKKRDMITVIYYDHLQQIYLKKTGMVSSLDPDSRILRVAGQKISIDDLYNIEINTFSENN